MKLKIIIFILISQFANALVAERILFQKEVQIAPRKVVTNEVTEEKKQEDKKKAEEKKLRRQLTASLNRVYEGGKIYTDRDGKFYSNGKTAFSLEIENTKQVSQTIFYSLNHSEFRNYSDPFTIEDEGYHKILYFAKDELENLETKKEFSVTIDNTPPKLSVNPEGNILIENGLIITKPGFKFKVDSSDSGSGLKGIYADDGTGFSPVKEAYFEVQNTGNLLIRFLAEDNLENRTKPVVFSVNSDGKKPYAFYQISKTYDLNNKTICSPDSFLTLTGRDDESGISKILYRKKGITDWSVYEKPFSFLRFKEIQLEAVSVDKAGNYSDVVSIECNLDLEPPNSQIHIQKMGDK